MFIQKSAAIDIENVKTHSFIPALTTALQDSRCDILLFPVHEGSHWVLLTFEPEFSDWTLYDSLSNRCRNGRFTSKHKDSALKIVRHFECLFFVL